MTTVPKSRSRQTVQPTLTAVQGQITTDWFLRNARRGRGYTAKMNGLIRFPAPRTVRVVCADGPLSSPGFVNGQYRCVAAETNDGGDPVFIDAEMLEDPGVFPRWVAEFQERAAARLPTPSSVG